MTAAVDGTTTTFWTVGADGQLVRRVQAAPGTALGPAEVVDTTRNWATVRTFIATPHALLMEDRAPNFKTYSTVRVFRPAGAGLVEAEPLFTKHLGAALTSVSDGYGEILTGNVHRRTWLLAGAVPDNRSVRSGTLPNSLDGYAGDEDFLGGLDAQGRITVLRQAPLRCQFNPAPFTPFVTSASTGWVRLVVPGRVDPEAIAPPPTIWSDECPGGVGGPKPWEWQ